jgi:glyoxylase-like metal-dependent hydrolase (beta-lactamase superfamily II)
VYIGAADAAEARGEVPKPDAPRDPIRIGPVLQFLWYGMTHGGMRRIPLKEVTPIGGAGTLDVPGSPVVVPLPGHTPGSVGYHVPLVDAMFMGDAMTTRSVVSGVVGPALGPFTVDPERALASLDALDSLRAKWVLPGHGEPWSDGIAEAMRRIRASRVARAA